MWERVKTDNSFFLYHVVYIKFLHVFILYKNNKKINGYEKQTVVKKVLVPLFQLICDYYFINYMLQWPSLTLDNSMIGAAHQ